MALAAEWGVESANRPERHVAADLGARMASQFGLQDGPLIPLARAPEEQRRRWEKLGIAPRGIDREIVELLHRTHHGVESDPVALLRAAMRAALADGWGGSMIATDVQDMLFGGPLAIRSRANLGVLEEKQVNILVHGHEPVLSEVLVAASREGEMLALARQAGAEGINIAGICCIGQRNPDAAGHARRGQLSPPGTGAAHRRGGPDGGGCAVRHAFASPGGRLPSHQTRHHFIEGPHSGRRARRVRSA